MIIIMWTEKGCLNQWGAQVNSKNSLTLSISIKTEAFLTSISAFSELFRGQGPGYLDVKFERL